MGFGVRLPGCKLHLCPISMTCYLLALCPSSLYLVRLSIAVQQITLN